MTKATIPVIDLFAGPGGLGEGFSAYPIEDKHGSTAHPFRIRLSIEKDPEAYKTLVLRAFYRSLLQSGEDPDFYYKIIQNGVLPNLEDLVAKSGKTNLKQALDEAQGEARNLTLGSENRKKVQRLIEKAKQGQDYWVLVGGPPCQAYSLVGRSRNKSKEGYRIEQDHRSHLYKEYLSVIAAGLPAVFVMENVKGMLSAKLNGKSVFHQILNDLSSPGEAVEGSSRKSKETHYQIVPVVLNKSAGANFGENLMQAFPDPKEFVVRCENHGVPQQRHRVILLGIRDDLPNLESIINDSKWRLKPDEIQCPTVLEVINDLPKLAGKLSSLWRDGVRKKSTESLSDFFQRAMLAKPSDPDWGWMAKYESEVPKGKELISRIRMAARKISSLDGGGLFIATKNKERISVPHLADWYFDAKLDGVANHESRSHLGGDLVRYIFSSTFAEIFGKSPVLDDFPKELIPRHKSAGTGHFQDRFKVQVSGNPATTITSHISKDGHYFIHHDPNQCRSLTVREAARIQTFPDNYFFCGPRTSQFTQVGNAVPPFLAYQLAGIVWEILSRARKSGPRSGSRKKMDFPYGRHLVS